MVLLTLKEIREQYGDHYHAVELQDGIKDHAPRNDLSQAPVDDS